MHIAAATEGSRVSSFGSLACADSATVGHWGVDLRGIGRSRPGDDFYRFVNARWIDETKTPAGYSMFMEMNAMFLRTEAQLDSIIRVPSTTSLRGSRPKIAKLFASYADTDAIERRMLAPIHADLDSIRSLADLAGVARWMARPNSHSIVGIYVYVDAGNPRRNLVHLDQQALGDKLLGRPGRAFFERSEHKDAYQSYIAATLSRAGTDRSVERAQDIVVLETRLAGTQWSAVQLRDRQANYHLMARHDLETYAPGFPWSAYLAARGVADADTLVLNTDSAIQASARIFADTPVDVWRSCLLFHWIQNHVDYLPSAYRQARFDLNTRLGGPQTQRSRENRATQFVNDNLGDLVGRAYVDRYFPPGYRERMNEIVRYLKQSFAERISAAKWLDAPTRTAALEKLSAMSVLVGYSDRMRDYDEVEIAANDLVGNVHRLQAADWAYQRSHLNLPASDWGWHVPPQRVDATYTPQLNRVVFPAGMLQAPAFDPCADPAVNFGAIAAVIAHEIGHGFDDQGSQFDARGRLRDWWTASTRSEFEQRGRRLATQFSAYSPMDGVHLDGDVSLGENIADLTGVSIALQAYHLYLDAHGHDATLVRDGFTGDQRFFLAWAQFWRAVEPQEWLRQAAHDSHAPPRYRVNSVLRNMDAWYDAFHVDARDSLYLAPRDRVRVW